MFYTCVAMCVLKVFIGSIMLQKMKYRLNYSYKRVKLSVILTMVFTILAIAANYLFNFIFNTKNFDGESFSIFWIYPVTRWSVELRDLAWPVVVSIVNLFIEILLMAFNTE